VWDLAADPPASRDLRVGQTGVSTGVASLTFSPDGCHLAAIDPGDSGTAAPGSDGTITWWATDGWREAGRRANGRPNLDLGVYYLDAAFAADGRLAVHFGNPPRVVLIDPASGVECWSLPMPTRSYTLQRTLSSRRGLLAVNWSTDGVWQRLWDWAADWGVNLPGGRGAGEWIVRLIDLDAGRECGRIPGASTSLSHWSPDGRVLAVQAEDGRVALWDVPLRKSPTLFLVYSALLALPIAGMARRRVRRVGRGATH
jgi:WD40 repeat protein